MPGIVYLLTNEAMPGLVKVGRTNADNVWIRMTALKTTGVPRDFECVKAKRVEDPIAVEKALHKAFDPDRSDPGREFFEIAPEQAIAVLDAIPGEDVTPEVSRPPVNRTGNRDSWIHRRNRHAIVVDGRGKYPALARADFAVIGGEDNLRPHELVHLPSGALMGVEGNRSALMKLAEALQTAFAWSHITSPADLRNLLRADGPERSADIREALDNFAAGGAVWREILRGRRGKPLKPTRGGPPPEPETF